MVWLSPSVQKAEVALGDPLETSRRQRRMVVIGRLAQGILRPLRENGCGEFGGSLFLIGRHRGLRVNSLSGRAESVSSWARATARCEDEKTPVGLAWFESAKGVDLDECKDPEFGLHGLGDIWGSFFLVRSDQLARVHVMAESMRTIKLVIVCRRGSRGPTSDCYFVHGGGGAKG